MSDDDAVPDKASSKGRRNPAGNRIAALRRRRGNMAQAELARRLGMTQQNLADVERRGDRITFEMAQRIAAELDVGVEEVLGLPAPRAVPIIGAVRRGGPGAGPALYARPYTLAAAPARGDLPDGTVAFDVLDASADGLWPRGSVLYVAPPTAPLAVGARVVVAVRGADGQVAECLAGLLDRSLAGELLLTTRSSQRGVPGVMGIQRFAAAQAGRFSLGEPRIAYVTATAVVDYLAAPDDPAEILGTVVAATVPG